MNCYNQFMEKYNKSSQKISILKNENLNDIKKYHYLLLLFSSS